MMIMKKFFILAAATAILAGCCQSKGTGPEETVEMFNRAITSGDFGTAERLCDTVAMKDYLDSYREAWETIQKEDSCALAIASSLLSDTVINIYDSETSGDSSTVRYTLEADGHSKKRAAGICRREGEWKITSITDVK